MTTLQDAKLAKMKAELGDGIGTVGDYEVDYVKAISLAVDLPVAQDAWMAFWVEQGILTGTYNDRAYAWLAAEGFTNGSLNDRWFSYWSSFTFLSATVSGDGLTILATLSDPAVPGDMLTGITLLVNNIPATLVSGVLQPGNTTVLYTPTNVVPGGVPVHLNYDGTGTITSSITAALMRSNDVAADNIVAALPAGTVIMHYDESTIVQSAGNLTRWNNRGDGGVALPTQYDITDINGPFAITSINGLAAVGRAGNFSALRIRTGNRNEPKPVTVAVAFESDVLPTGGQVQDIINGQTGSTGVIISIHGTNNVYRSQISGGNCIGVGPISLGPQVIISKIDDAGNSSIKLSGSGVDNYNTQGGGASISFIRMFASVSAANNQFQGSIGEVLVWDRLLTDSEIRSAEAFLAQKWGAPQ